MQAEKNTVDLPFGASKGEGEGETLLLREKKPLEMVTTLPNERSLSKEGEAALHDRQAGNSKQSGRYRFILASQSYRPTLTRLSDSPSQAPVKSVRA